LITVKDVVEGLWTPPTVTVTSPEVAALGTLATIWLVPQLVMDVACVPLKETVLVPWLVPKLDPTIVTDVPLPPKLGEIPVTIGVGPRTTETLLKVPVVNPDVAPLSAAKPT